MPIEYLTDPPRHADVVIVGGGIAGAASAFYAARAGLGVLVVERRPAAATVTTAAAAGGYRLQQEAADELALARETVALFDDFAEATGQREFDPAVRRQGYLFVTTSGEGAARQRRLVARQRDWGVTDVELLDGEEVRARFGFIAPEVVQGRFRAGDGLLEPRALALGLLAGAHAPVVTSCTVLGLRTSGGRVAGVLTDRGAIDAGVVVIAAGPFSATVAAFAGIELPVTTVRRQKVVLPAVDLVPPWAPMTIDEDTGAHWRPALQGATLLFTDPSTPPSPPSDDVPVDNRFAFQLLDPSSPVALARVTPFWREVWETMSAPWLMQAGHYSMTPDHKPLIGPTAVDRLYVNTGCNGHGVMASAGAGRLLAELLTGACAPAANPFRLDRAYTPAGDRGPL